MLNDKHFFDEVFYFSEDETDEKVNNIFSYIQNNTKKFLTFLNTQDFNVFDWNCNDEQCDDCNDNDEPFSDFSYFITNLYSVFCYDIENKYYKNDSDYSLEYEQDLKSTYFNCFYYLVNNQIKDKTFNHLVLIKSWNDGRKENNIEILDIDNLSMLLKQIYDINKYMIYIIKNHYIGIHNCLLLFQNPKDSYYYAITTIYN